MPPKKQSTSGKKTVRIGGSTTIEETSTTTTRSGRLKRTSIRGRRRYPTRARVPKVVPKQAKNVIVEIPKPAAPLKRGRGRPPKALSAIHPDQATDTESAAPKRGRGRPKRETTVTGTTAPAKRGRGRATKEQGTRSTPLKRPRDESPETSAPPKKRGRPAKSDAVRSQNKSVKTKDKTTANAQDTKRLVTNGVSSESRRSPRSAVRQAPTQKEDSEDEEEQDDDDDEDGSKQYWLMKAEPNSRIEKGHDVKFSIDDLAAASKPEAWDGVRNVVARNHMRSMRLDDLAFFYHSNCAKPGIVGIMRIVAEHAPDESAFDPKHPYYDPKSSRETPKWDCVKVKFVKKFEDMVGLQELKYSKKLKDMSVVRMGRLSVSPVTAKQWKIVLGMAGEDDVSDQEVDNNDDDDDELNEDIAHVQKNGEKKEGDDAGADEAEPDGEEDEDEDENNASEEEEEPSLQDHIAKSDGEETSENERQEGEKS